MDAKTKIEISLRAAIIIKDMSAIIDCDDIESMINSMSNAIVRLHELDKVLFGIQKK